jgi:hypothetical protein
VGRPDVNKAVVEGLGGKYGEKEGRTPSEGYDQVWWV